MVSGFFGAGAADQFNKQQELDTAESRVRNQAEQFRTTNALKSLEDARDRLEKVTQLGALPQFAKAPSFQGVIEGQRRNVVRAAQLAGITDENQLMTMIGTSSALGQGAIPLKAFEERQTAAATEAEQLTVRDVPQPDGSVKTMVLRGGQPIGQLGQGFRTQVQPDRVPGASSKERSALDESEIATRNALRVAEDVKGLVREGGAKALSAPGALSSGTASLLSSVEGMAQLAGIDTTRFEDGKATLNKDERADTILGRMKEAANISAELKSAIVNLAFSAALASGQSGRGVSDRDYERFVKELGAGAASPERFEKVLTTFQARLNENFRTRFRVQSRRMKDLQDKPIPDPLKELKATAAPSDNVSKLSDDELRQELSKALQRLGK